jgi:isopentenyl diphosphate isomerase/L-lactate dehydrogenase-like FMN-dependent dehydrogenase
MIILSLKQGQRGVELVLDILKREFQTCMQLAGCAALEHITTERVRMKRDQDSYL